MKNITVSVDDEVYRRSRIKAAEKGTSVSALVREYLASLVDDRVSNAEFKRLKGLQDDLLKRIRARGAGIKPSENLSRDALHDRNAAKSFSHTLKA